MLDVFFSHHWHKSVSTLSIVRSQGESVCLHNMWKFHVFIIQTLQRRLSGVTYTWAPVLLWHALTPCSPGGVKKVWETLFPYLFPTYRESVERRRYDVPFRPPYGCFFVPHQPLNDAGKLVSLETAQHSTEAGLLSRRHFSNTAHAHRLRYLPAATYAHARRIKKLQSWSCRYIKESKCTEWRELKQTMMSDEYFLHSCSSCIIFYSLGSILQHWLITITRWCLSLSNRQVHTLFF